MSESVYIIAAARTAVVPRGGAFRDIDFDELAVAPIHACLKAAALTANSVEELIVSNALGAGGNPARVCALRAGLPRAVGGLSIDRQCSGGLDAILLAQAIIQSGQAEIVIAGGSESYSLAPERAFRETWDGAPVIRDQARFTPWPDQDPDMTAAANTLARAEGISREEQNRWAMDSHTRARGAAERLREEICCPAGLMIDGDPFTRGLNQKICDRADVLCGTITAANTSVAADGAAFALVVSERVWQAMSPVYGPGLAYGLRIVAGKTVGGDHQVPGLAPVDAIRDLLETSDVSLWDIDTIELMEAYAVQAIACARRANLLVERINPGGGSLARGHPIGASGAILAVRLFHDMRQRGGLGLAAIAAAGGLGTAAIFQAVSAGSCQPESGAN